MHLQDLNHLPGGFAIDDANAHMGKAGDIRGELHVKGKALMTASIDPKIGLAKEEGMADITIS